MQDGAGIFVAAARSEQGHRNREMGRVEARAGKGARLRPPGALFFGLAAFAERHDFRWVDGIIVDLHFDNFAALVDQVVDAASCFVLGIVETVLAGDIASPVA